MRHGRVSKKFHWPANAYLLISVEVLKFSAHVKCSVPRSWGQKCSVYSANIGHERKERTNERRNERKGERGKRESTKARKREAERSIPGGVKPEGKAGDRFLRVLGSPRHYLRRIVRSVLSLRPISTWHARVWRLDPVSDIPSILVIVVP